MKRNLKTLTLILTFVLILAAFSGCGDNGDGNNEAGSGESRGTTYVNIGTGGTAGTYYPLGGAMAEIWQNNIDGVIASAESTGASVANVNLLGEGMLEVVIIQNDIAYYAQEGTDLFENSVPSLMGMACLYSEPLQCITTDPSIQSISDLAGKRVAVGAIGSGVYANVTQILEAAGLTESDLGDAQYLSFAEAATSLKDRQIDAAFIVAGVPTSAVVDLSTQRDVYLVPIDGAVSENLKDTYSFYTDYIIPAGTYSNQTEDIQTLTVQSMLAVHRDVEDDLVYEMLESMFGNLERIRAAHSVGEYITAESALEGMSVEVHPGAARYFADNGIS